jgi:outer membrane protein
MKFKQSLANSGGVRLIHGRSIVVWAVVISTICAFAWLLTSQKTAAQPVPTRIAVIDVQRVLSQSNAGRAATAKLKQLQDARLSRAKALDEELRKLNSELTAAGVTAARRATVTQQIADKRIAMQRFAEDADKEIGSARARELQALELRIKPIVDGVGKEMTLAAIFNKFESGLVYVSDALDITDTVITRFNAAGPTQPATPRD